MSWRHAVLSAGSIAVLLIALTSMDSRVARTAQMVRTAATNPAAVESQEYSARETGRMAYESVRGVVAEHAPLAMFGVVALVLTVLMVRT